MSNLIASTDLVKYTTISHATLAKNLVYYCQIVIIIYLVQQWFLFLKTVLKWLMASAGRSFSTAVTEQLQLLPLFFKVSALIAAVY